MAFTSSGGGAKALVAHGDARATFDAERLSKRLEIADAMYARKYGPVADRLGQANVVIQPYADIETYELRGLYRQYEVED